MSAPTRRALRITDLLSPAITMLYLGRYALLMIVQRLLKRVEHEVDLHQIAHVLIHGATGKQIDLEDEANQTLPIRDVLEIADRLC